MTTSACLGVHRREVGFTYHRILIPERLEEGKKRKKGRSSRFRFRYRNFILLKKVFFPFGSEGKGVAGWRRRGREGEEKKKESLTGTMI